MMLRLLGNTRVNFKEAILSPISARSPNFCHNLNLLTPVKSLRAISRLDEVYFNDVYLSSGRSLCCLIAR